MRPERKPDPVTTATALVARRFPEARAAFLGGTVLGPLRTPTSDLDVVVIRPDGSATFRETVTDDGWLVELFVPTLPSYRRIVDRETAARRCPLLDMVGDGVVLPVGDSDLAAAVHAEARVALAAGPPPASEREITGQRYGVSGLLDDLRGATDPGEAAFVTLRLVDGIAVLALLVHGGWLGTGKWLGRRLRDADPDLHDRLVAATRTALSGEPAPLDGLAEEVLARAGGPLQAGYRVDDPPESPTPIPTP